MCMSVTVRWSGPSVREWTPRANSWSACMHGLMGLLSLVVCSAVLISLVAMLLLLLFLQPVVLGGSMVV